jgi:hypothetical protein
MRGLPDRIRSRAPGLDLFFLTHSAAILLDSSVPVVSSAQALNLTSSGAHFHPSGLRQRHASKPPEAARRWRAVLRQAHGNRRRYPACTTCASPVSKGKTVALPAEA